MWNDLKHSLTHKHVYSERPSYQMQLCLNRWRRRERFVVKVLVNGDNRSHAVETDADTLEALLNTKTPAETYRWLAFIAKHVCDGRCEYV